MSWTKRGTGTCPSCHKVYSTRWKPEVCSGCGYNIGGNVRASAKKPRLNQPGAVLIYDEGGEKLFSVNTSTRDDRCFVVEKGGEFFCGHKQCKDGRATFVASDKAKKFSCSHVVKCKAAISFECSYELSVEKVEEYQGSDAAKQAISDTLKTREFGRPVACKISDVNYVVLGPTSTNNTMQYAHVRNQNGKLVCCSKDSACNKIVAKGKYERAKNVCVHLHTLFCVGALERIASSDDVAGASSSASAVSQEREEFNLLDCNQTQRENSIKLGAKQTVPYHIPPALLRQIDERNAGATLEWPKEFIPHQENCGLCGSPLGKPIKHSGSDGTATLITSSVCFRNVEIRVKVCSNKECKAINREQPYELGLFNIADSVLVSLDILLEWREHLKLGHPISNVIAAKLELLNKKLDHDSRLTTERLNYLNLLLYNGFYCYEAITQRNLDDVICGICGIIGEVYLGDGNEENCCNNQNIIFPDGKEGPGSATNHKELVNLEDYLARIANYMVEKCVYTAAHESPKIHMEELPPIIAMDMRGAVVYNTEKDKKSSFLESDHVTEGDSYILAELIKSKELEIEDLPNLGMPVLKEICNKCGITVSRKSAAKLRFDINSLYASLLVGLCPCHGFDKAAGKTGGFYHIVCRHGTTVASKFLTLTESVRDAADLYLSLKYQPLVFINDSSCGFTRHLECRAPEIAEILWDDYSGCFEKPEFGKSPKENVDVPDIVPLEYRTKSPKLPDPVTLQKFQHPLTTTVRRYVLGDRFHNKTNPHKHPLCVYHDIEKCKQSCTIKTSYQEVENGRKNRKRLRSACSQSFHVHFFFNYLMDYYQNEAIVEKQKEKLKKLMKENQTLERDVYKRFIIKDNITTMNM